MLPNVRILLCAALVLSQACAAQPPAPAGEGVGPEDIGGDSTAIRIAPGESDDYFSIRRDYRRCAHPFCGGYWVRSVNEAQTECGDGTVADECYVTHLDLIVLGLSEREQSELRSDVDGLILRGGWGLTELDGRTLMFFEVEEAWRALTDAEPDGWIFKAMDNGVRCVTTPCDTLEAAYLNYPWWFGVDRLDLRRVGLTDDQIADVRAGIADGGVLVAGRANAIYRRFDIRLRIRGSQVYLPIEPSAVPDDAIACGGFAGLMCPGSGECVDDPRDSCDPATGGADCGGYCECNARLRCPPGHRFDDSAGVCACVDDTITACAAMLCPVGTRCVDEGGEGYCVSDGSLACGSATCAEGTVCCNSSCGICTPPGFACIQIACAPEE